MEKLNTFLFIPAYKDHYLNNNKIYNADCIILDIEDSVPIEEKVNARMKTIEFIKNNTVKNNLKIAIRINPIRTILGIEDLHWILQNNLKFDYLMPSKVQCAGEIKIIQDTMLKLSNTINYIPLIETIEALENIYDIAKVLNKGDGLAFGSADFAADIGVDINWETMIYARQKIVVCANSCGLMSIDSPFFNINEPLDKLRKETRDIKNLGFTGKLCILPNQVDIVNDIYNNNIFELEQARELVKCSEKFDAAIIRGKKSIIGPPFIRKAKKIIESMG